MIITNYYIYILLCKGNVYYTGITTDFIRRFDEHIGVAGLKRGAKFTKSHMPIKIVALWRTSSRSKASKLEIRIKKLSKSEKSILIKDNKCFKLLFKGLLDGRCYKRINI